jgi:hypothetical protein
MSEKRSVNLCSIYVLPLLGLNRYSFGSPEKFINSYVSEDDKHIVVECTHPFTSIIVNHANFKFTMEKDEKYIAVFNVPVYYMDDVKKFREGKYSQFTDSAKTMIRKKSGLTYKVPVPGGGYRSALELLALDKDKELKSYWEKLLQIKLSLDAELASIPGEDNFYNLNLSNQLASC